MTFHIITTFPKLFTSYLGDSILARAIKARKIAVLFYNPRDFAKDKWHKTDGRPYGGGPGMVMLAEPLLRAVEVAKHKAQNTRPNDSVIRVGQAKTKQNTNHKNTKLQTFILAPAGEQFTNTMARKMAKKQTDIILICGRYEGIDARVKKVLRAKEISVGPYVLTGGELPSMIMLDAVARQISGVLGKDASVEERRVSTSEVYTRPELFEWPPSGQGKQGRKYQVPKVLLSGHAKKIEEWKISRRR
ncbi:MAG: hypothetical protein COV10_00160 [Candidatus Vogelbacteria bacterium CG10_big_fil_rev_8_21_14_0_10_51_16]|uniref:tRNA (guanine-N(1)-)-methyltransferase n=1 Tax=Candidatus Vogelbacteria bacterium CG10_big_fil_rev_8_21_14_0_10_51_16 TaxID=1975045 RepID=A0A2H0RFX9_9BACT|nr:MAG: hypothetical protein COV10_00160 [Candidatus Vogelbacteria bacterium CG10_big_fil_rev_8_21_14_0_10_51_16]